jgi:enhancing lycopene biosynthesis protein 2
MRLRHYRHLGRALRCFADQRAAVAVAGSGEGRGHVAPEGRDIDRVHAVADREAAAGMIGIGRIAQGGARAETDACEVHGLLPVQTGYGYARECLQLAEQATEPDIQKSLIALSQIWMEAALEQERPLPERSPEAVAK